MVFCVVWLLNVAARSSSELFFFRMKRRDQGKAIIDFSLGGLLLF